MSRRQIAFGILPAGSLANQRMALVSEAWTRLAGVYNGGADDSRVPLDVLVRHYDANRHPLHVRGWTSKGRLHDLFVSSFKQVAVADPATGAAMVTKDSFVDFYVKLSQEVQTMRQKGEAALDPNTFFCDMVAATWHLEEEWGRDIDGDGKIDGYGSGSRLQLANSNADDVLRPTGLKALEPITKIATDVMDFIWADAKTGRLVGFRGVTQPLFARSVVPAALRGHFALAAESRDNNVRYVATRPTNQPPLDFVWEDAEHPGVLCGLRGVVSSAVDLVLVPDAIKKYLSPPQQSDANGVAFLDIAQPTGPTLFKKISDGYGLDAVTEARRVAALKKAVFEGTACGNVYATTWSGKFSDQFPGGPWRQAGLNTSSTKSRVEFG